MRSFFKKIHGALLLVSRAIGWFMTKVLLSVFFFVAVTPIALIIRLVSGDTLDRKLDPEASSYWRDRERKPFDPRRYEKPF